MNEQSHIITKYMRRFVACAFGFVVLALTAGCNRTTVRVVGPDGAPVASAEVYANNLRIGQTDASGVFRFPMAPGTALVARKKMFEGPGWRDHHDPDGGLDHTGMSWTERVYLTSMNVNESGALEPLVVADPAAEQTLVLRTDNTLIGLHFMVSVIWDASAVELQDIADKFQQAGDYIYNATDGQIYFEQIDIVDDSTLWRYAEYHYHADINVWPNTWSLRGLFVQNAFGSAVSVSRRTPFQTIAHEFGHFGFGLMDEYMPGGSFCTSFIGPFALSNPVFGIGMPKASCVMDKQMVASKYCSNHGDNPHVDGSLEAANCWSVIASGFSDRDQTPARWTIKTPDTRRAIVGPLPSGSSARWQPRINIDNRTTPGTTSLCLPFNVAAAWPDGSIAPNWAVTLEVGGRLIEQGLTDSNGVTNVVGAHPNDRIWVGTCCGPWRTVVATPSLGPNTCGAP